MTKTSEGATPKKPGNTEKSAASTTDDTLRHLAFDNTAQANIISTASNGKIVMTNKAACKLLGYSKKELLTKSRADIFDIKESSFKEMLKERTAEGQSIALVTCIKKSGKQVHCEITSAVFMDEEGIEKAITTIRDMSQSILKQKELDSKKDKVVADNIALVESKQKSIDIKKEKKVADNIAFAKSAQEDIDAEKEKEVAGNIVLAQLKQKNIDIKKEKIVIHNIALAKSKQIKIDTKKEQAVADNIILAQEKSDARLAESKEWIKYIAKASYDVMWDWDIVTSEVYVGDSIEEVFGYKVRNNTINFAELTEELLAGENNTVKRNLMKVLVSGSKSWSDSYSIKRFDGSIAAVTSRASIVRDEEGKAIRLIGATQDVSKLQELERKLEEQITIKKESSDIFHLAARLSYDGIWDWNILTNEFFLGEGFEELFGYTFNNTGNKAFNWGEHLHPDDRAAVENGIQDALASSATHWEHTYRFIRANGSVANVFGRASIIRDADGKACRMIGAIHDLSRQKELEEKLEHEIAVKGKLFTEYKESFKLIFNSSSDVLYDIDLLSNKVVLSDAYEKEFGYKITEDMTPADVWPRHIHPDDIDAVLKDYHRMLASEETEWKYNYRFLRADNSVANILSSRVILRNVDGKAYRMIGSMQDVSKQKVLEERLEQEIRLKEKQIADATEEAKETERSDIGKELHDNVNQLLGVSRLYLEMAKRGGEESEMYLSRSSEYTLTAIDEIRKLTKGLTTDVIKDMGLYGAIDNIVCDMMEVNPVKISFVLENFSEHSVNDKFKMNLFRIVQEQLNNILKHSAATGVAITLSQNEKSIRLTISDDGVGFDTTQKKDGIGLDNIKSRATSYSGVADFISQPGKGCVLTATFPVTDAISNN